MTTNAERARALPIFGDGYIPPERDKSHEDDTSGFMQVLLLLLRSWPYIRPQLLGRWWIPGEGVQTGVADMVAADGYRFDYAPFVVGVVAVGGPLLGFVPATLEFPLILLYVPAAVMVVSISLMTFGAGAARSFGTAGVVLAGIGINVIAAFVVEGWVDGVYAGLITVGCLMGWMVQFRINTGRLQFRIRIATHLVYFYAINFAQRFIALALGLILADLLNQNILQNEPIAPGLAALVGVPEWAQGSITELTQEQRLDLTWIYVYLALGSHLLQLPLRIINPYYNMWIKQRINQDLRLALVERWHLLSLSYHSDHRTGDSIFRIYQDSAQITAVIGSLIGITLGCMSYLTCVLLVTLLEPWIGFMCLTILLPAIFWARWAMPRMRTKALVYRAAASDVTSTIQESFGAIKLIKAFGTADRTEARLNEDSVIAFNAGYRVRLLIAFVSIVLFTVSATFFMAGEFLMALWAHREQPTFATELIGLIGVSFVVWNLASFSWTRDQFREGATDVRHVLRWWMVVQDMAMGLYRVFDILDIEPDVQDRPGAKPLTGLKKEIRFDDVSFAYEANRPVLDHASFSATPGSVTAIIGPTGSGKSTLMALLLRLFDPDKGSVTIDGTDLRDFTVASLRASIAIALQENVLFAMSVRDNIRYVAPDSTDEEVGEAVRIAAMDEYVASLPEGLDTRLSDRGGKLSTGQRQRLSIARAVVRNTPVLILDEPTAALDAATEHQVMQNLAAWAHDRAVFIITHRISTIRRADQILYLDGGRIVESGGHDELMAREGGRYRAFVDAESNMTGASS